MSQEVQIQALEERLLNAMRSSNPEVLDELIHEKMLFNLPNGITVTKATDIENHRSGAMKIDVMVPSNQNIVMISNNAVVTVTVKMKANFMGQPIKGTYRFMRVWQLNNEKWQIIGGSSCNAAS